MNLRQIEAFKAVMENGTVVRAAEVMHISQPAVTKLIQAFERAAGFRVFDRVRGRLLPTAEGLSLYREVERVFVAANEISNAAEEIRTLRLTNLSVGAMPALSTGFAQRPALSFLRTNPNVAMQIQTASTLKLVDLLSGSKLDIAFCNSSHEHPEVETELLSRQPLVCILPPKHPLAARREIVAADLEGEPFTSWSPGTIIRLRIDALFDKLGVNRHPGFSAATAPAICAFVAHDLGIALVHPLYIGTAAAAVAIRPFEPRLEIDLLMAYPKRSNRPEIVKAFAEMAVREARILEQEISGRASAAPAGTRP